jgi:hypothetical protein
VRGEDRARGRGAERAAPSPPPCRFHTRCWKATELCRTVEPPLEPHAPRHRVACHFPEAPRALAPSGASHRFERDRAGARAEARRRFERPRRSASSRSALHPSVGIARWVSPTTNC